MIHFQIGIGAICRRNGEHRKLQSKKGVGWHCDDREFGSENSKSDIGHHRNEMY